uniref:Uncharacterized protein n=1 Tax=Romanomermis culicivorax TaxID=13658 RepID=A0A915HRM9_ROMCU
MDRESISSSQKNDVRTHGHRQNYRNNSGSIIRQINVSEVQNITILRRFVKPQVFRLALVWRALQLYHVDFYNSITKSDQELPFLQRAICASLPTFDIVALAFGKRIVIANVEDSVKHSMDTSVEIVLEHPVSTVVIWP